MRFEEALVELRKGKKILSCPTQPCIMISLSCMNEISITIPDNLSKFSIIDFIVKGEWFVHEEPGKTFPEVFV